MIRKLQWDSDFFNLSIGRIDLRNIDDWREIIRSNLSVDYNLVYVFSPQTIDDDKISLVDIKTIYSKSLSFGEEVPSSIDIYNEDKPNESLYALALDSGVYSRFRLDKQLPSESYERLYKCWIEQSTNGQMADKVFVHRSNDMIDGMITLKIDADEAHIGLVAVGGDARGKGIGSQLIKAIESYLLANTDVRVLKVVTQWDNISARRLYEKNGFVVESKTNIYHWWV